MPQQVFVQVRFSEETPVGQFNDAIYYLPADYATKTQKQIDADKDARVANYVDIIQNAPPPKQLSDYTKDELIAIKNQLLQQENDLQAQFDAVNTEIGKK